MVNRPARFAELGYEGTTIESIARRAGMAKGSFYLHFHSKEEIFRALMQKAGDWLVHRMRDIAGGEDSLRG